MKTVLCLSLALAVNASIVAEVELTFPTADGVDVKSKLEDPIFTDSSVKRADAKEGDAAVRIVADAPQLVYTPLTADEMKANAIVQSKLFKAGLDKSPLAMVRAGGMEGMLPLKCSVLNCKDWNCGTWCWCFENYGDQIQPWLDVYADRAGCLADDTDCNCDPDKPYLVTDIDGPDVNIYKVPLEWVRRPSQCFVCTLHPPILIPHLLAVRASQLLHVLPLHRMTIQST